jgi:hypothetical protein
MKKVTSESDAQRIVPAGQTQRGRNPLSRPAPGTAQLKGNISGIYDALHAIYSRHRRTHRENPDSKQMCCMWSTNDPPDLIEGTEPLCDIEEAFGIQITDDEALELYDMNLAQAARMIVEIRKKKSD